MRRARSSSLRALLRRLKLLLRQLVMEGQVEELQRLLHGLLDLLNQSEERLSQTKGQPTSLTCQSQEPPQINEAAALLGQRGGLKGGLARAKSLSKERMSEIAKKAAKARWDKFRLTKKEN